MGLPTPPSAHSNSALSSPAWESRSGFPQPQAGDNTNNNQFSAPEQSQAVFADDPFISFDSFMALPPQDYPSASSNGMHAQDFSAVNGNTFDGNTAGFPFLSWSNMDLDHSWNFAGVDGPLPLQ
jgi:hypothetical protein